MSFSRLVRFIAKNGRTYYGDAILPEGVSDSSLAKKAFVISGDVFSDYIVTNEVQEIGQLLSPLSFSDIQTVRLLGMNYRKHAIEINTPIPKYPVLFYKPKTAITGPFDSVKVPIIAQEAPGKIDYEVELVIVIGREGRNIPIDKASEYILGYTIGNDVSQRTWQIEKGGSQFSTGKMFDTWAPIGPAIVSTNLIQSPNELDLISKVNGELRQSSNTKDMIFSVFELVSFLSQGTTLRPGDLIFTGTPQGVGMGFKPAKWLKDGDITSFYIENIGRIENKFIFENKERAKI
ncbi:hypothetical protein PACTADRAFT_1245 [Pachysolen tannophilus NRRL Y-2460]|uniref:Fumarylacetoacetase-like C-terminal domain-containing protein n=1 Tax=Pachysolen tannophilus NRRL Y-2460 TaxID=669874 RepID=A0A1E4TYB9_PACTA|nr:hypothetical protein PACTADRAFT_1245 [Pachysolen tannophilus NRRL Y-2460]